MVDMHIGIYGENCGSDRHIQSKNVLMYLTHVTLFSLFLCCQPKMRHSGMVLNTVDGVKHC